MALTTQATPNNSASAQGVLDPGARPSAQPPESVAGGEGGDAAPMSAGGGPESGVGSATGGGPLSGG